jgi:hypothetical protein
MSLKRTRHADLVLELAGRDQRLMDSIARRPHLLNPYPSIVTRLSRRSRKFRLQAAGVREMRHTPAPRRASHLTLVAGRTA